MTQREIENKIATLTGGRAAEEIACGEITTGASNDIEQATKLARAMITRYGMSEEFGMVAMETVSNEYLGGDTSLICSPDIFMLLRKELIGPVVYNSILRSIANGKTHLRDIVEEIGEEKTKVSKYCKVLMDMDILGRTVPYGKDAENSRKNPYYFKDNAHLFWYRFVFDNDLAIAKGEGAKLAGDKVFGSALDTHIVNLTFDRICLQYYNHLSKIGNLSFTPNFIGLIDDSAGADVIVSDKNGQSIIAVQCLWNKPAVGAEELGEFVERYSNFADNPQYSVVSANGYKTDAMRLADSRNDIELLGLDDLEAKR